MRFHYIQPGNEDEFQEFCIRLYRQYLKRSSLVPYAKRGEKQHGVDIIDLHGIGPFYAIQCKHHEPHKNIPPKEIKDEVAKAETCPHPIERFIIATTAKKSKNAQDVVIKLNQRAPNNRKFVVEIHFWEEICSFLGEFTQVVSDYVLRGERSEEEILVPTKPNSTHYPQNINDTPDDFYGEIAKLLENRRVEAAEYEIDKLPSPELDRSISDHRRYAIFRLKAKLAIEKLDYDEGIRLFNLAYETLPDLEQANQNRVLALELSGKHKLAFLEATKLIVNGMKSSFILSLLIRNADTSADLLPYQELIDQNLDTSLDINLALVNKRLIWNQDELAKEAAVRSHQISPDSAYAHFSCGMVEHNEAFQGKWENRSNHLAEAIGYYTNAIKLAIRDKHFGLLPEIYINRGRVNFLAGNKNEAGKDFINAVDKSKEQSLYAESAITFFLNVEDFESAWNLLSKLDTSHPEAEYLKVVTEYHCAPDAEKFNYIQKLVKIADHEFELATDARFHAVNWSIVAKDFELARNCVSKSFIKKNPFLGNTLLCWIEFEYGNKNAALKLANKALDASSNSIHREKIAILAKLLVRLNEDEKSLPLLELCSTPGILNEYCNDLIACAQRLGRHDILLRICDELRQTNQQNNSIRKIEVQLLSQYNPELAFNLTKQFQQYDEAFFRAAGNLLAIQLQKTNEIEIDNVKLPSPSELSPEEASLVLAPYIEKKRFKEALEFAYQQVRIHSSNSTAHGQYIWYIINYCKKPKIAQPDSVDLMSAVCLENLTTKEKRWVIVEDDQPDSSRNEFPSSSQIIQKLLGKKINDVVNLRGQSVQIQEEMIAEIKSKYVHQFQDSIHNFENRFPDEPVIQSVHLGSSDQLDLSPITKSLEERRDYIKGIMDIYHGHFCSLYLLASHAGIDERKLIMSLGSHNEWFIRCADCNTVNFAQLTESGFKRDRIVLDISSIVTLSQLGVWDQIDKKQDYIVSQTTLNTIADWYHELAEQAGQPIAYSSVNDSGKVFFEEISPEQTERNRKSVESMLSEIKSLCDVKSSMRVSKIDPQKRDTYIKTYGYHSLESICTAADCDAILWSDDLAVGKFAEKEFNVSQVWTQLAFKIFENNNKVSKSTYSEITAKLVAWNYITTVWNPQDIITAGELSDWDSNVWPFKECLRQIGNCSLPLARKSNVALEFLKLLRRSNCIEFKQSAVVQATLDNIGNTKAVNWMLQQLDNVFRIDFPSAEFFRLELLYWLRLR